MACFVDSRGIPERNIEMAARKSVSKPTLADVFCGLEPGDRLEYSNQHGQTFIGTVQSLHGEDVVVMLREEWQALGFGPERLIAGNYWLESVLPSK